MKSAGGCRGGHWGAPPEGECGSHTVFLSWTRLLGASVSSRRLRLDRNSVKLAGADRDGKQHYLSAHERVRRPGACWRGPVPNWQIGRNGKNRARISIEEPGVASCRQARDNGMASTSRLNPYQCDECGNANIVAAPVVYHEGTRTYSGTFYSGTTQSYSAQAVAPPKPRGYIRPFLVWGPPIVILFVWTALGATSILEHPTTSALRPTTVAVFLLLGVACLGGMLLHFRNIARYNREVYPRLYWNWEHTYICRRCGRSLLIPS